MSVEFGVVSSLSIFPFKAWIHRYKVMDITTTLQLLLLLKFHKKNKQ